jgi:Holliday junction DNA helicase RuvA
MIRSITGTLEFIGPDWVLVRTGGFGLKIIVPTIVPTALGALESQIKLHTHMAVRDDGISLYGFLSTDSLKLFELLLNVSGVGPRHALGLLSAFEPSVLVQAITTDDIPMLSSAPGIGKKTAARIILEVRQTLEDTWQITHVPNSRTDGDVLAALIALGYTGIEARAAMASISRTTSLTPEEHLRLALQYMAKL